MFVYYCLSLVTPEPSATQPTVIVKPTTGHEIKMLSLAIMSAMMLSGAYCMIHMLKMGQHHQQQHHQQQQQQARDHVPSTAVLGQNLDAMALAVCFLCGCRQRVPREESALVYICCSCRTPNPVPWRSPPERVPFSLVEQTGPLMEYEFTRANNTFFRVSGEREHRDDEKSSSEGTCSMDPILIGRSSSSSPRRLSLNDLPACTICMVGCAHWPRTSPLVFSSLIVRVSEY
ncbi:hypothetical protein FOL47_008507 [Perkinsus chesapeaki]|uniref:Uncharacterized protein n=1 Tax=Perkinsus chesapeaki TaxID=330153 RepID=A0A7J6MTJ5_PERCH|nr:hypothetical protein FOL47_008507 [Perkinsus chesapeaki]